MELYKKCTKCKETKLIGCFAHIKPSRRHSWCRPCQNEYGKAYYEDHKEKQKSRQRGPRRKYLQRRREKFIKQSLCERCGKPQLPNSQMCEWHYISQASGYSLGTTKKDSANRLLAKFNDQGRKCPYTEEPLILGINAQLDHIKPRSFFPDLKHDIDNLEWVSAVVNRAKQNMTKEEFLAHYKITYNP